jgi:hypothetical protein
VTTFSLFPSARVIRARVCLIWANERTCGRSWGVWARGGITLFVLMHAGIQWVNCLLIWLMNIFAAGQMQ